VERLLSVVGYRSHHTVDGSGGATGRPLSCAVVSRRRVEMAPLRASRPCSQSQEGDLRRVVDRQTVGHPSVLYRMRCRYPWRGTSGRLVQRCVKKVNADRTNRDSGGGRPPVFFSRIVARTEGLTKGRGIELGIVSRHSMAIFSRPTPNPTVRIKLIRGSTSYAQTLPV
jgi:hypothetical protein